MAEILTLAELEEHQLRSSVLASRLRTELEDFKPTELEFRSIFRLMREFGRNQPGRTVPPEAYCEDGQAFADPKLRESLAAALVRTASQSWIAI